VIMPDVMNVPAEIIARKTGVDEIRSELLPPEKISAVESLITKYHNVAMVGKGWNDTPAVVRATLGISIAAKGSDVAIDIVLLCGDLSNP
jgi:Zn2+/Cd2+-exporting ATPase